MYNERPKMSGLLHRIKQIHFYSVHVALHYAAILSLVLHDDKHMPRSQFHLVDKKLSLC